MYTIHYIQNQHGIQQINIANFHQIHLKNKMELLGQDVNGTGRGGEVPIQEMVSKGEIISLNVVKISS